MGTQFTEQRGRLGPPDSRIYPRFMGSATFARLPRIDQVSDWDVAIVGVHLISDPAISPALDSGK